MLTLPFTVAVFMVREFEKNEESEQQNEQRIGRLTGLLAALYSFAQCFTSLPWAWASNHIGRKPVMMIGSASNVLGQLLFGLSSNYAMAASARVAAGLLNGLIGAWKCMLGEMLDSEGQGKFISSGVASFDTHCLQLQDCLLPMSWHRQLL